MAKANKNHVVACWAVLRLIANFFIRVGIAVPKVDSINEPANVANNIIEWREVFDRTLTKKALRENYIVTLAITISAFGRLGRYFYEHRLYEIDAYLHKLRDIDWLRSNTMWIGRALSENGKIQNSEESISLTCSLIKMQIGLPLTKEETQKEKQLSEKKRDGIYRQI